MVRAEVKFEEVYMTLPANPGSLTPEAGLQSYINAVYRVPVLDREEEVALCRRLAENQDLEAAKSLITAHLRYVVYIARTYSGYGLPLEDIIQQGNVGLMKSVRRFSLGHGVRLISFAVHWIRAEIHEYILRNWRIVRVATTKAQRKLFFNLRKAKKRLGWLSSEEAAEVAEDLKVDLSEVLEMDRRLTFHDESFDLPAEGARASEVAPASFLAAENQDPAGQLEEAEFADYQSGLLQEAITCLDSRSRDIVESRWLGEKKVSLRELAEKYGVSLERIRQLEVKALASMREAMAA